MADYSILKAAIADYVKDRTGLSTIDGDGLQETLLAIVNSIGVGYVFMGVADLTTNPGTPDQRVWYLASTAGIYANFNNTVLGQYEIAVLKWDTEWHKEVIPDIPSKSQIDERLAEQDGRLDEQDVRLDGQDEEIADFKEAVQNQVDNYPMITINGNVTNAPDEEDLTSVEENGNDVLKFKNRSAVDGMGYKILRKGTGLTFANQVTDTNTIYEIRYDFDLDGASVAIPSGCVLKFVGGSLKDGTISLNDNTTICGGRFDNVKLINPVNVSNIAIKDSEFSFNFGAEFTRCCLLNLVVNVTFENCKFFTYGRHTTLYFGHADNIVVTNCLFDSDVDITEETTADWSAICLWYSSKNALITNNRIEHTGIGIAIQGVGASEGNENKRFVISGNIIRNCVSYGIILYKADYYSQDAIISNNLIENVAGNYINLSQVTQQKTHGAGIYINLSRKVICSNNIIKNVAIFTDNINTLAPAGIALSGANDCSVIGNFIEDAHKQGIIILGDRCIVSGNIIKGDGEFTINVRLGTSIVITNNVCDRPLNVSGNNLHIRKEGTNLLPDSSNVIKDILLQGNQIIGRQNAVYIENAYDVAIRDNFIKDFYGIGVAVNPGENIVVAGNKFSTTANDVQGVNKTAVYVRGNSSGYANDNLIFDITKTNTYNFVTNTGYNFFARERPDIRKFGSTSEYPANINAVSEMGLMYFNTTFGKPVFFAGSNWAEADGAFAGISRYGTFANKPAGARIYVGFVYFCTDKQTTEGGTNGIPIYYKGSDIWVDSLGRTII